MVVLFRMAVRRTADLVVFACLVSRGVSRDEAEIGGVCFWVARWQTHNESTLEEGVVMKSIRDLALGVIVAVCVVAGSAAAVAASPPEATVTKVTPASVTAGQLVTIRGTNLESTQGVSFGTGSTAMAAASMAVSPTGTWVRVGVPSGLPTGTTNINLNVGGKALSVGVSIVSGGVAPQPNPQPKQGPTTSKATPPFPVRVAPIIGLLSPNVAAVGTRVTIQGRYLGHLEWVRFAGVRARVISNTATKIVVRVPMHAHSGRVSVHTAGGISKSAQRFTLQTA
jgi:hypothetical protein